MPQKSRYIRLSERTNALDYLERTPQFIRETGANPRAWKWVVIALHGAVYGFAISAAQGPDNLMIQPKRKGQKRSQQQLASFWKALELCQEPQWMRLHSYCKPLVLTESQQRSMRFLNGVLRNRFAHFAPMDLSIDITGMPDIAGDSLTVIRFLALETGCASLMTKTQQKLIASLVAQSIRLLSATAGSHGRSPESRRTSSI